MKITRIVLETGDRGILDVVTGHLRDSKVDKVTIGYPTPLSRDFASKTLIIMDWDMYSDSYQAQTLRTCGELGIETLILIDCPTRGQSITGRLLHTKPELQNIPLRTELGRELHEAFKEEQAPIYGDYSKLENRVVDQRFESALENAKMNANNWIDFAFGLGRIKAVYDVTEPEKRIEVIHPMLKEAADDEFDLSGDCEITGMLLSLFGLDVEDTTTEEGPDV